MALLIGCLGLRSSMFYDWRSWYGKVNEHDERMLRDHWPQGWKRAVILDFEGRYPREGYRQLAFMMLDQDVAAAREMVAAAGNQLAAGPT